MYGLNPSPLRIGDQRPRYLIGDFRENEPGTNWSFTPEYRGSIHISRWRVFGDKLKALIRANGDRSIPQPIRQFFGLFQGPLADLGLVGETEVTPLSRLIDYACTRSQFDGITTEAFAPKIRNLAIYRNQSLDDYLRRLGPALDPSIIDSPSKVYGAYFHTLATGLASWQIDRFGSLLSHVGRELARDQLNYGLKCALLFSGLVQLDFSKIVNNPLYDTIPAALRDIVAARFRDQRYIPGRTRGTGWQVDGEASFHFLRLPRTIPDILTPRPDWLPRIMYFLSEEP
jgi:hypothetical protein